MRRITSANQLAGKQVTVLRAGGRFCKVRVDGEEYAMRSVLIPAGVKYERREFWGKNGWRSEATLYSRSRAFALAKLHGGRVEHDADGMYLVTRIVVL